MDVSTFMRKIICNFRWHVKCVLTKLCCDASSISNVCICRDKSPSSIWAPWRASVFCDTCTCTSAIWKEGKHGECAEKEISCKAVKINALPLLRPCYLVLMPAFEVICVLCGNLLVVGPHVLYDLGQVLTFGSVHVDLHAWPGDLIPQLYDVLREQRKEREQWTYRICGLLFPEPGAFFFLNSHSRGSSSGRPAPPSQLQSRSQCWSWSSWCHPRLSSAQQCRPPQTAWWPAHCRTCGSAHRKKITTDTLQSSVG